MTKQPFNIELPQEFVDRIMVEKMFDDYQGVIKSLKELEERDNLSKRINLYRVDFPVATMKRICKYVSKGYTLSSSAAQYFVQDIYTRGVEGQTLNTRVYID